MVKKQLEMPRETNSDRIKLKGEKVVHLCFYWIFVVAVNEYFRISKIFNSKTDR